MPYSFIRDNRYASRRDLDRPNGPNAPKDYHVHTRFSNNGQMSSEALSAAIL